MAASLLRIARLGSIKCLRAESWRTMTRAPAAAAFSTKSGGSKKTPRRSPAQMDPIQKLFLDSIRQYTVTSRSAGGLVDAGSEYEKTLADEVAKLQRLYGGGDLTSFPEFTFPEPTFDEVSQK